MQAVPPSLAGWQTYDHYGYATIAVVGTFLALGVVQWLLQWRRSAPLVQSLAGVVPPFINIIGVLFALTLAFLANDTWSAHDRAMKAVYREAMALNSIHTLSERLPAPLRAALRDRVEAYARASADEWPQLARRHESPAVRAEADALLLLVASDAVGAGAGDTLQAAMLARAGEVLDERDQRVALSQTHVNPLKWLGMGFLGLLTLLSVALVHVDKPRAAFASMLLFALAAAPTAAIVLIQGNPFQQPSAVTPAPILEVAGR